MMGTTEFSAIREATKNCPSAESFRRPLAVVWRKDVVNLCLELVLDPESVCLWREDVVNGCLELVLDPECLCLWGKDVVNRCLQFLLDPESFCLWRKDVVNGCLEFVLDSESLSLEEGCCKLMLGVCAGLRISVFGGGML